MYLCKPTSNMLRSRLDSPLHEAVTEYSTNSILEILDRGSVDIDTLDSSGQTALHWAIWKDFTPGVQLLIDCGSDMNIKDNNGQAPLHIAARYCKFKLVEMLVAKGAKIAIRDKKGQTPLHVGCVPANNEDVVKLLLISGSSVNFRDDLGRTPLHHAVNPIKSLAMCTQVVRVLFDWGASVNVTDRRGETPIDAATSRHSFMHALKKHTVKCRIAGFLWNEEYEFQDFNELSNYQVACLEEIERMKTVKLGKNVLYHILSKYGDPTYVTNIKLKEALSSSFLDSEFPNYASLLRATFERAKRRQILLNKVQQCFMTLLPTEVVRNILFSVKDEDLENVMKANNCIV